MNLFQCIFELVLGPLLLLFDVVYAVIYRVTSNQGFSIVALSLTINFLILPLYKRADAMQEEERIRFERMKHGVNHIKKAFKGDERFMMLQTYYRQNDYKPYYALNGSVSLLLEIPFFIAAFKFLSGLRLLNGASFGPIRNLGSPDEMLHIAGYAINLLPILMTVINIISGVIYTKGMPLKSKLQLYGMALIFFVFLYSSPSGLVFYWTLNNLFSLVKNIFYKLKNPKLVFCILCTVASCLLLISDICLLQNKTVRVKVSIVLFALLLSVPLAVHLLPKKYRFSFKVGELSKSDSLLFYISCITMTLLTGLLIPSAVINSSPSEFVNINDFYNPIQYLIHPFNLAAGTFLIWMSILYFFSSDKVKKVIGYASVVATGAAIVDYMFFGKDYGNMSSLLQYDNNVLVPKITSMRNLLVLFGLFLLLLFLWKKRKQVYPFVSGAVCMAVLIMSCMNVFSINSYIQAQKKIILKASSAEQIKIPLDKKGKNVIVIMLDRAVSDFIPYIFNEKPELQQQFAGFTYYPNTITYGYPTLLGSQAVFGGYEYLPQQMNDRDTETLVDKRDEALKVMPKMFMDQGYEVTVCDPPYAGSYWIPDLSIYDEYPSVHTYITKDRFSNHVQIKMYEEYLSRNFFAYSLFRISPLMLQETVYNSGNYNQSDIIEHSQSIIDFNRASGGFYAISSRFSGSYSVLGKLPEITKIRSSGQGTFMMMGNDTAHDVVMLQEPAYEPSNSIDNSEYEENPPVRYAADGRKITFTDPSQLVHYQCNMAAMIQLGQWMEYLRESGVYDNTRIIITSDHGAEIDYLTSDPSKNKNEESFAYSEFMAFMMVKDFDSKEFTTDNTFMTNADTPSIAFSDIIQEPTNPFTGKKMTTDVKNKNVHRIADTDFGLLTVDYDRDDKLFKMINWVELTGNDTSDVNAWRMLGN